MSMTDPIADMLTRIRNALMANHDEVEIPFSRMRGEIASILKEEGYIRNFKHAKDRHQGTLTLYLKYDPSRVPAIQGLRRVSKPGRRVYVTRGEIPQVMNGLGISILSTSRGVLTDQNCREKNVGGEVLCYVW
jgi:small subunit ribosomal protein S8